MSPATRLRWRIGIVLTVLAACVGAIAAAWLIRPAEASGYGPELERAVTGACKRSAPDVDDPDAACRCAYTRLTASMSFDRFRQLDNQLRSQSTPPAELVDAVKECSSARS